MEAWLLDWLNLLARWAHLVTGIAWIGASFYFIWLDDSLEASRDPEIAGELWAVHGGGFYHSRKFRLAPPALPERLHWFKWEAYWTWITGFFLLVLIYYAGAELYLIDRSVANLSQAAAIGIGIGSLVAGWLAYDLLCRSPLGRHDAALAAVLFLLLGAAAWGLCQVFGGRGAFIHYGAIIGTIMVANVAMVIIPGQRELVRAKQDGRTPDPRHGLAGKQRSVHNTYLTLPTLFAMISSHYAMTFSGRWNWLALVALTLAGALIRVWFVLRHREGARNWPLVAGLLLLAATIAALAPRAAGPSPSAGFAEARKVIDAHCASCHAEKPSFQGLAQAPKGVLLDTPERIRMQAPQILQQSVLGNAMPPGNLSGMTAAERELLGRWVRGGARTD